MKNLIVLQKEIYLNEQKILKEYKNSIDIKKAALKAAKLPNNIKNAKNLQDKLTKNSSLLADLEREQQHLNENINDRFQKLEKAQKEFIQLLQNASKSEADLNPKISKMHEKWRSQLSLIQREITGHKNIVLNHDDALKKQEEKNIDSRKKEYEKEKKKLFSNAPSLLSSPKSINDILKPLAEKKDNSSISLGDVSKTALSGGVFAINNISSITSLLTSAPYYIKEAKKIPAGRKNSQETSFFLNLLDDKDTIAFIKKNSNSISDVIDTVAPTITSIIFREVGKLDALNKKLKSAKEQYGELSDLQKSLFEIKDKSKDKENLSELEKATISNLEKGINSISSLENRIKIATAVRQLQDKGIDSNYISTKILPIALGPIKELLKEPQNSLDIVNSLTNIALSENPGKEFVKSFNTIANKVDIETILESSNFKDFLANEGQNLANAALIVIQNSDTFKKQTEKFGLKTKLISNAISTSSVIASTLLSDTKKIDKAYKSFFDLSLSTNEENLNKISTFVNDVSLIVLKDDTMNALKQKAPNFLKTHQEEIGQFVSNIPDNFKNNIVGKFVDGVKKESVVEATRATSNVLISVLENLSNEDIRDITSSAQKLITSKPGERLTPTLKIGSSLVGILENKEVATSIKNFGEFIDQNKNEVDIIVTNIIDNTRLKEQLSEFGVTDKIISDTIPIITSLTKEGLANTGEFKDIYNNAKDIITSKDSDQTKTSISNIIGKVSEIALKDKVLDDFKEKVPKLLGNKDLADVSIKVVDKVRETEVGKFIVGIDDKVIKETFEFGADLASKTIQNVDNKDIRSITSSVQELITSKPEERLGLILNLGDSAANILENKEIAKALNNTAKFIDENNSSIKTLATNFIKNNQVLTESMKEWGVEDELITKSIETGSKLISECMPTIIEIAPIILKDKNFKNIIPDLQTVIKNYKKVEVKDILKIVDSVVSLKDNKKVKEALENKLPEILTKNSENIGHLIDDLLNKTKIGKSLQLNTKKIIEVTAKKIPALSELSTLFNQKSYGKMIPKVAKFIFDKEFLSVVVDTGLKLLKNQKLVSSAVSEVIKTVKDKDKLNQIKQSLKGYIKNVSANTVINKRPTKNKSLDR
jgi:hypothetical protein